MELDAVSVGVGGRTIVEDISFGVPAGSRVAIVGPNGAGKTTLLRAMAGLTAAVAGTISVSGRDLTGISARERAKLIAFVGQDEQPPDELRVGEMVALGRIPHRPPWSVGGAEDVAAVRDSLERVGLFSHVDRPCAAMSGGEQRRALLARGMAQMCPVLMLDEPTNHLDIAWQIDMMERISAVDSTVVASMHDLDLVLRHFDLVAVLSDGEVAAFGPPGTVLSPDVIGRSFGVGSARITHPATGQHHLLLSSRTTSPQ